MTKKERAELDSQLEDFLNNIATQQMYENSKSDKRNSDDY